MRPPSAMAETFVRTLLERDPEKRLTARQALQLPFLRLGMSASGLLSTPGGLVATSHVTGLTAAPATPVAPLQPAHATNALARGLSARGAIRTVARTLSGRAAREEPGLTPVLREARKRTHQFKAPINPIVQRSLDELLQRLQEQRGPETYFSEPAVGEEPEEPVTRRDSKSSTHSGVFTRPALSTAASAAVAAAAEEATPSFRC